MSISQEPSKKMHPRYFNLVHHSKSKPWYEKRGPWADEMRDVTGYVMPDWAGRMANYLYVITYSAV